jgi:drug/metabolite transporter (DMT)-like permease
MSESHSRRDHRLGLVLVAGSAIAYSTAGIYARAVGVDVWTTMFWRCAFAAALILAWLIYSTGSRMVAGFRGLGLPGLAVAVCGAAGTMSFLAALQLTSVADVLIIQATAPFVAAFLGRIWLKEPVQKSVLVASGIAFLGVGIMIVGSIGRGSIRGDLLAMLMTLGFALAIVVMRRWRHVSMMPAVLLATVIAVLLSAPLARPLEPSWRDFVWLALFGCSQMGLGWILLTTGAPKVPAAEAALLGVLEVVLAPIWVWLAFNEVPSGATLLGGGLVLAAVLGHVVQDLRRESYESTRARI